MYFLIFFYNARIDPHRGKWNIKACQTGELAKNWDSWCQAIGLVNPVVSWLVTELLQHFEVVKTYAFETEYDLFILRRFEATVEDFIFRWRRDVANWRNRNYYHWLAHEAKRQIYESGSIWKYASDITESFVHVLKDTYLKFSNRGGLNSSWTKQVLNRVLMKVQVRSMSSQHTYDMMSRYERRKFVETIIPQYFHDDVIFI